MAEPGNQDDLLRILDTRLPEREPFDVDDFAAAPPVIRTQGLRLRASHVLSDDEQYPEPRWREDIEEEREAERRRQEAEDERQNGQDRQGGGRLQDLAPRALASDSGFDDATLGKISIDYDPNSLRSMARAAGSVVPSFASLLAERLVHGRPQTEEEQSAIPVLSAASDRPISFRALSGLPDGPIVPPAVLAKCLNAADSAVAHKPQIFWATAAATAVAVTLSSSPSIPKEVARPEPVILDVPKTQTPPEVRLVRSDARYTVSNSVPLRTVALDLNIPMSELQAANPGLTNMAPLPAGTVINAQVEASRVALPQPASVEELAESYGVSVDAITAVNEITADGTIVGAVNVPGLEVIPVTDPSVDLAAVALHLGLSDIGAKELSRVNAAAPEGQLLIPRFSTVKDQLVDTSTVAAVAVGDLPPVPPSTTASPEASSASDQVTAADTVPAAVPTAPVTPEVTAAPVAAPSAPTPEVTVPPVMVERPATPEEKFAADIEAVRQALDTAWKTGDMGPLNHMVAYSPIFKGYQLTTDQQENGLRSLPPANLLNIPGLMYEISPNTPANERIANSYAISGLLFAAYSFRQEITSDPTWAVQYADACLKVGDLTAHAGHKSHKAGTDADMNSVMHCDILYGHAAADGPVAWVNRSGPISFAVTNPNYNAELDKRLLLHLLSLHVGEEQVIAGILYNGPGMQGSGVRAFPNHGDHYHLDIAGPRDVSYEPYAHDGGRPEQNLENLLKALWLSYAAGQGVPGISQSLMVSVPASTITSPSVPVVTIAESVVSVPAPAEVPVPAPVPEVVQPVTEDVDSGPTPAQEYDFVFSLLLNEIASGEAKVDEWNAFNHGKSGDARGNYTLEDGRKITQMTLAEVMQRQSLPKGHPSRLFAVGRYQIIPKTMRTLVESMGVDVHQPFSPQLQNLLAAGLIFEQRPNVAAFIKGDDSKLYLAVEDLCQEWASVPCNDGTGHYDGDSAGNGASGGRQRVQQMRELLEATREKYNGALAYMLQVADGQKGV